MSPNDPYQRDSRGAPGNSRGGRGLPVHGGVPRRGCSLPPRLVMALALAAFAIVGYFMKTRVEPNPITGERQRVSMSPQQEVAMGLQAAPEMAAQHGGSHPDPALNQLVKKVGKRLVDANTKGAWAEQFAKYQFNFHLLRDSEMVNAFALPGGQIFFTYGLLKELKTEDDVAGVLGHEIGHVVGRHSAEQMARSQLWAGIAQAAGMAGADFNMNPQQIAGLIYQVKTTSYGRDDENEADDLGVKFMVNAGYDPAALINVMQVLKAKGGSGGGPEFLKTHPDPGNRIEHIKKVIEEVQKNGTGIDGPPAGQR
jgi:predicted Zn-dependent protease